MVIGVISSMVVTLSNVVQDFKGNQDQHGNKSQGGHPEAGSDPPIHFTVGQAERFALVHLVNKIGRDFPLKGLKVGTRDLCCQSLDGAYVFRWDL
jgi:hypothetical protein